MGSHFKTPCLALLLCSFPAIALAGEYSYLCDILQAVEMTDDGHFVEHKGMWQSSIGNSFSVNRLTGEMVGFPFESSGWLGGVKIISPGGDGHAYIAMVLAGGNIYAKYIYIADQKEGRFKPFWGSGDDRVIFSGTCV